jgi:hypothetical protein
MLHVCVCIFCGVVQSVKVSCGEGGCGACAVEVIQTDPTTGKAQHGCAYVAHPAS